MSCAGCGNSGHSGVTTNGVVVVGPLFNITPDAPPPSPAPLLGNQDQESKETPKDE